MRAADLDKARRLLEARDQNLAMFNRLEAGEPLSLLVGESGSQSAIVIAPGYAAGIRADLLAAFKGRLAENDAALAGLGVEP